MVDRDKSLVMRIRSNAASWRTLLFVVLSHANRQMPAHAFSVVPRISIATRPFDSYLQMSDPESGNESLEVLRSLVEFHHGTWAGQATSFSVTADVAAGIVHRKVSPVYKTSVRIGLANDREFSMTETFQWDDKMSSRTLGLVQSNMDVDSVDASYSLDTSLPDIPSAITGTDKLLQFGIEHCIAVNEEARVRCLAFYGVDMALARVVVLHEQKVKSDAQSTQDDLLTVTSDIDRIVNKITGQVAGKNSSNSVMMEEFSPQKLQTMSSSTQQQDNALSLHPMSLLELTSGIWLGDSIVRDLPSVQFTPFKGGSGFVAAKRAGDASVEFGSWELGVQKTAWRWIWDYGESIRQQDDVGKAMGSAMAEELSQSLSGTVCVNESMSRRIPRNERMVYIDWNNGDHVGFLLGSVSIQLPRFITFDPTSTKKVKPFYTEFCVYQSAESKQSKSDELLEVCCSKITRLYNYEGKLKQGCTSFYTLNRLSN